MLFCRQTKEFSTVLLQTFSPTNAVYDRESRGRSNCAMRNFAIYDFIKYFSKQPSQMRWNTVRMGQIETEFDIWWDIRKGRGYMGDQLCRWEQL
jgi:hypothetical protein